MNTNLREYIDLELMPALYDQLDSVDAFPEFAFKRMGTACISTTQRKHTGRDGKTKGQVIVYQNNPAYFIDHSEAKAGQNIIEYVQHIREGKDIGFMAALNQLADMAGIKHFTRELTEEEREANRRARRRSEIWEAVVNYCRESIRNPEYKTEAAPMIEYLTGQRKYNIEDIQKMQLGYLRNTSDLTAHLLGQGIAQEEIDVIVKLPIGAGTTHRLVIPVRNASGHAVGLALRNVQYTGDGSKYINTPGLKKSESLYNLHGKAMGGNVLLVEGQLDALIAMARGYEYASVAALMGKTISDAQITHLERSGAKKVFICLDNEEATLDNIKKMIEKLTACDWLEDHVYIVQLPEGIKDVDELITVQGIEAFDKCVRKANPYYTYLADLRLEKYETDIAEEGRTGVLIHDLIDDFQRIACKVNDPAKRDDLKELFSRYLYDAGIPITEEAFADAVERIRYKEGEEKKRRQTAELLKKGMNALDAGGDANQVLKGIKESAREIEKQGSKRAEFDRIRSTDQSEAAIMERFRNMPESVETGFHVNLTSEEKVPIILPAGQLTFVGAAMNHGKTLILANWALNIIDKYPKKTVYFFTFEISADAIIIRTFLSIYIDVELNKGGNQRALMNSFSKGGSLEFITSDVKNKYLTKKKNFFEKVTPRLKVINVEYSADEIIEFIEDTRRKDPDAVIMIDYIQKMRSDRKGHIDARFTELKFVCEDLNACAMRTGLPIVLAAQFNRNVASPLEFHAQNLAEASDIEKIASEIIGVWNCAKKLGRKFDKLEKSELAVKYKITAGEKWQPEDAIVIEVLKSRSMSTGHVVKLNCNGKTGKIGGEYGLTEAPKSGWVTAKYVD